MQDYRQPYYPYMKFGKQDIKQTQMLNDFFNSVQVFGFTFIETAKESPKWARIYYRFMVRTGHIALKNFELAAQRGQPFEMSPNEQLAQRLLFASTQQQEHQDAWSFETSADRDEHDRFQDVSVYDVMRHSVHGFHPDEPTENTWKDRRNPHDFS